VLNKGVLLLSRIAFARDKMGHITYPQFPDSPGHPNVTYSESEAFYTIDHSVPGTTGYYRRCHVFH